MSVPVASSSSRADGTTGARVGDAAGARASVNGKRHFAGVEVHCPTAEEPVLEAVLPEQLVEVRQRYELIFPFTQTKGPVSSAYF